MDQFGFSVAVSGDTAIVGAPEEDTRGSNAGAAYVFQRDEGGAGNRGEVKKLLASDAQDLDFFGWSVAVSGDTAIVGALGEDAGDTLAGAAYVFGRDEGGADSWGEVKKLTASDPQSLDQFGNIVAVSGDTVLVGATFKDSLAGAAYVFQEPTPTPTNTPTNTPVPPTPIGGIGIFPMAPGGGTDAGGAATWLAAGAVAGALALGGGAW